MTKEITPKDIFNCDFDSLFPPVEDESLLLLGCRRSDYSASAIARAVEDCNAHVLNLNITSLPAGNKDLVVSVRTNHRNTESIVRSLERYGYEVLSVIDGANADEGMMRARANEVLRYLEM